MMKKGLSLVVIAAVGLLIISCAAREEKAARADNQGQPITIAAGDFYEACGNWAPGEKVTFKFTSSLPVMFDVHYHDNYAKMYTIEQTLAENLDGSFVVNTDAVHCCMWKNDNTKDVTLSYELSVGKQ
jgi:hypothetical protein